MDPADKPVVSGPLVNSDHSFKSEPCSRKTIRSTKGQVIAKLKYCWSFYRFDPAQETDAERDYGAYWIQSVIAPKNGWCATKAITGLAMDSETVAHRKTLKDFTAAKARRIKPRLVVDAAGTATTTGMISKPFRLYPKKLASRWIEKNKNFKMVWRGTTRQKVGAAGGLEVSWTSDSDPPLFTPTMSPELVSFC
jgi:hypothetical protein